MARRMLLWSGIRGELLQNRRSRIGPLEAAIIWSIPRATLFWFMIDALFTTRAKGPEFGGTKAWLNTLSSLKKSEFSVFSPSGL
jgi:hypothetical protein